MRELTMEEARLVGGGEDVQISCCKVNVFGIDINVDAFSFGFDIPDTPLSDPMDHKLQIGPEYQLTEEDEAR